MAKSSYLQIRKVFLFGVMVIVLLIVLTGAYFVATKQFIFNPHASNTTQSATGQLVKKGTAGFSACTHVTSTYALLGGDANKYGSGCLALVVNASQAEPFVDQRVIITGVYQSSTQGGAQPAGQGQSGQNGVFYVTTIAKASNLEQMPGVPSSNPKASVAPTPKVTPCPGLGAKAACNPGATSPSQKCCAPYTCQGIWNGKTTTNYTCSTGVRAF